MRLPGKLLSRFILMEVLVPTGLALVIVGFLGVASEFRECFRDLPVDAEYVTGNDVARILLYLLPTLVTFIVPITYMMGILLGFGALAQHNEITAMKAAGVPLKRLLVPVIAFGAVLSAGAFVLQDAVQPAALRRASDLIYRELPMRATIDMLPTGKMHQFGDWRVYIRERDPETKTLYDVDILQPQPNGDLWAYWAKSARLTRHGANQALTIYDGHVIMRQRDGGASRNIITEATLRAPPIAAAKGKSKRREWPLSILLKNEGEFETEYEVSRSRSAKDELRKIRWEIGDRLSLPLSCLAVCLLAAPLAVRGSRGGRSYSFAIGFSIIIGYQVLRLLMEPDSLHSMGVVIALSLVPNMVLTVLGLWALWRVDRV